MPLGRARARAIRHLAAGNHRAYVVLFDFLDKESLDDLVCPFMDMVDDLTPYYQDRMRQLPPAQRKIVEFLCLQGKPTTIKSLTHEVLCKVTKNCSRFWIPAFAGMTERGVLHDCRHSLSSPRKRGASGNPEVWFRLCRVRTYRLPA